MVCLSTLKNDFLGADLAYGYWISSPADDAAAGISSSCLQVPLVGGADNCLLRHLPRRGRRTISAARAAGSSEDGQHASL
jgi:hypothetical protein